MQVLKKVTTISTNQQWKCNLKNMSNLLRVLPIYLKNKLIRTVGLVSYHILENHTLLFRH
jgi:hypothetical protein